MPATATSIKGVIGTNGLAAIGEKKESACKKPVGVYPIGGTFGTEPLAVHIRDNCTTRQINCLFEKAKVEIVAHKHIRRPDEQLKSNGSNTTCVVPFL